MEKTLRESLLHSKDPTEQSYIDLIEREFDYEVNRYTLSDWIKLDAERERDSNASSNLNNSKLSIVNSLNKRLDFPDQLVPKFYKCDKVSFLHRNWIKAAVSKQKIRFINQDFDLDLIYMTKRLIGMGYPATNCEALFRNSLTDVQKLFKAYHDNKVKIYNLCVEKNRIYEKSNFSGMKVGLFPAPDHSPCQIKMMLAFCVDICLFLLEDKDNIAAVHCKAGKGRTGSMICAYLVFTGICENMAKALDDYALRRSHKLKGITIASQRRYLYHFETYLKCNFTKPYYKLIPRICKSHLTNTSNLLLNFYKDKSFSEFINVFNLKKIKIGPFNNKQMFNFKLENFKKHVKFDSGNKFEKVNYKYTVKEEFDHLRGRNVNYSILEFNENFLIDSDFNLRVNGQKTSFNAWINFYFVTLEFYLSLLTGVDINQVSQLNSSFRDYKDLSMSIPFRAPLETKSSHFVRRNSEMIDMKDMKDHMQRKNKISELRRGSSFTNINNPNGLSFSPVKILSNKIEDEEVPLLFNPNSYLNLDTEKIKYIFNNFTNFNGENILNFDLNNLYTALLSLSNNMPNNFTLKQAIEKMIANKRKIKIKLDLFGVDKLRRRDKLPKDFQVEITYLLV